MAYDIDFKEKGQLKLHIRKFLLYPPYWGDINNHYNYNLKWKSVKFNKINKAKLPNAKGIYCFVVKPKIPNFLETRYLFYVGQTTRPFQIRYQEYLNDLAGKGKPRPKIFEMLKLYKNSLYYYYAEINQVSKIDDVEEKLLYVFVPQINTANPKAKIKPELKYIYE